MPGEIRRVRKQKYRDSKIELKRIMREIKKKVGEDFGFTLSRKFKENQKLFWREVKESVGQMCGGEKVKDKNGDLLKTKKKMQ